MHEYPLFQVACGRRCLLFPMVTYNSCLGVKLQAAISDIKKGEKMKEDMEKSEILQNVIGALQRERGMTSLYLTSNK